MVANVKKSLRTALIVAVCALTLPLLIDKFGSTIPAGWVARGLTRPASIAGAERYRRADDGAQRTLRYDFSISHDGETGVATSTHISGYVREYPTQEELPPVDTDYAQARRAIRERFDALCAADGYPQMSAYFDRAMAGSWLTVTHEERQSLVSRRWFLIGVKDICRLTLVGTVIAILVLLPGWIAQWRAARVGCCSACGYDLRGTAVDPCPECGRSGTRA